MPVTPKKSTKGDMAKNRVGIKGTAIAVTPKVKTDKAPASRNTFNTRELEDTKQRIIQQMNNDRLRQRAKQDAERAQSEYNMSKYQVRDSSMPLAPTQFNDM